MTVTVFPKLYETTNFAYRDAEQILQDIKSGGKMRKQIEQLRQLMIVDPARAEEEKKKLPGICFGGKFEKRMNSGLVEASGLMILDFDKTDKSFAETLMADPFIWAFWISPRGEGFKALVKIPVVQDDAEYKRYFYSFNQRYPNLDPSGKDVARICYFSYDPDLVIKPEAQIWDQTVEIKSAVSKDPPKKQTKPVKSDWKKISIGLTMLQNAGVGNRHDAIIKAGRLMGGYIATGEIDELDVMNVFEKEVMSIMDREEDFRTQWKTFIDGIGYGKADPIRSIEEVKVEEKIGTIDFVLHGDVRTRLLDRYKAGKPKGYHVGFDALKALYKVVMGGTTYIYGSPFSGKTQALMEILVNLAVFYGMKHAIFSSETGSAEDIFEELVQIVAQRDFTNEFGNQMTPLERDQAMEFVEKHFIIIDPEETEVDLSPKEILDYVNVIERKYNTKIHTITIDPWNELRHDEDDARDVYLNGQLKLVRRHAKKNQRHIFLVTHVKDMKPIVKNGETFYPIPTPGDIAGGPTWFRKGLMMLSFWRPTIYNSNEEVFQIFGRTLSRNSTIIQVQKAKPKGVGKRGEVELFYNAQRHRYYESGGMYAHKIVDDELPKVQAEFVVIDDTPPF